MTSSKVIDFYFDFACPYAYLASTRLSELSAHTTCEVRLRPVLLGGIFRALEQPQNMSTTLSPAKARHNRLDLLRWASWLEAPLAAPLRHPNRTVEALRYLLATPSESAIEVVHAFYALYWSEGADISDTTVLSSCLEGLGLDAPAIAAKSISAEIKDDLRQRTHDAVELGVFGVPTFIVEGELFFGQDRIEMVGQAANGWKADPELLAAFDFNQKTNDAQ
jgi:2-hydroxychromene-2-carboxylate isomerase